MTIGPEFNVAEVVPYDGKSIEELERWVEKEATTLLANITTWHKNNMDPKSLVCMALLRAMIKGNPTLVRKPVIRKMPKETLVIEGEE